MLEDTGELVQSITAVLAGAQGAGVDPAAVTSLQAAVRALDPGASTGYDAGSKEDRQPGGGYRSDGEFLEAAAEAEGDVLERLREAEQLQEQLAAAMDAAQAALDAAYAMPVKDECDGCHGIKAGRDRRCAAPHRAVRGRGRDPGSRSPGGSGQRSERLRQVPQDLGEVYQLVYEFIRKGGKLPVMARWIEGAGAGQ